MTQSPVPEYKVYGMSTSGNCYKVKLLLEQLGMPYQWQETDTLKGETRTPQFLALNPSGQVPTLEIAPGRYLPESNAILYYLAEATPLWPTAKLSRAQVLQWMFFEQYSHEPYVAVARFICKFLPPDHSRRVELPRLHERGYQALDIMEQHLREWPFFAGDHYSIADIALFAYTHVAEEGGFELNRYTAINSWMERIKGQPGFVAMC